MNKILRSLKENWLNYTVILLLVIMIFSSVGSNLFNNYSSYDSYESHRSAKSISSGAMFYDSGFSPDQIDRKITKNGNLKLESDNYNLAKENILTVSEKYSVILLTNNEHIDKYDYRTLQLTGKVNALELENYLTELKKFGEIDYFEIYSNDVTESYVNYDERINRYSNQLVKYESMLSTEISFEEEIQVQRRIDELEDQLFYLKKNFDNLDERVVYSEVSVRLVEEKSVFDEVEFVDLENGFKAFISSLGAALWVVVYVAGFVIPFIVIFGIYRLFRKFIK